MHTVTTRRVSQLVQSVGKLVYVKTSMLDVGEYGDVGPEMTYFYPEGYTPGLAAVVPGHESHWNSWLRGAVSHSEDTRAPMSRVEE